MTKAYDLADLEARLKAQGLPVAEGAAKLVIQQVAGWLVDSAALSANKIDDVAALGIPELETLALGIADKIDGKIGD